MLFLLSHPAALLGAALGLLVGIVAHSVAQAATARAFGDRLPTASGRLSLDPRRHFEPFGIIVMLISGIGWNKPVPLQEPRFRGGRTPYVLSILAGPVANLVLGVLGLLALRLTDTRLLVGFDIQPVRIPGLVELGFVTEMLVAFTVVNIAVGILTLIPLPPLDGARLLWLYAPKTGGWRNARYQLEERNIGVGLVVVLSLPLFGGEGLLKRIVLAVGEAFAGPIARAMGISTLF